MTRQPHKFYIDYLDHLTSESTNSYSSLLSIWLRFDLLVFCQDTLCLSVPAFVKLQSTTDLLVNLDEFWANNRIQLQLDKKHHGNPLHYFSNRKSILSHSMSEKQLSSHFEFLAYEFPRTPNFYKYYIPQFLNSRNEIFIPKNA